MAFDLNKSKEEKTKTKFNLSKTSEPSPDVNKGNESIPVIQRSTDKRSKRLLFIFLGIICLAAVVWFISNKVKSADQKITGIEQASVNNHDSTSGVNPSNTVKQANANENENSKTDSTQTVSNPKMQSSTGAQSAQKMNAVSAPMSSKVSTKNMRNTGQNASKASTSVPSNIPYKKNKSYKVYLFPFGDFNYSQTNPELEKLANVLKENLEMKISITAYTDDIGDKVSNKSLSDLRAKSIHDYLISKGVNNDRMNFQGKGISTKYETKAENRRAEFVISE